MSSQVICRVCVCVCVGGGGGGMPGSYITLIHIYIYN